MSNSSIYCSTCKISVSVNSHQSHITGKRHRAEVDKRDQKEQLETTGLCVQGIPHGVSAADVGSTFGRYGNIAKVEVIGELAFVYYADGSSREEALRHQHSLNGQILSVEKRMFRQGPSDAKNGRNRKRTHGGELKKLSQTASKGKSVPGTPETPLSTINQELVKAFASPAPISEHMKMLKEKVLAGENYCQKAQCSIFADIRTALRPLFKSCDLYPFGSMITGLAFKTSDLDVYAHLELNQSAHFVAKVDAALPVNRSTIFQKVKTCLYKKPYKFTSIVPIPKAKTPIIKVVHVPTKISIDLSFRDALGYKNSRLVRHYLKMNDRFFELIFFIKYWAGIHNHCSSSKISNYALCILGITYLISLRDSEGKKLVPSVHDLVHKADASGTSDHIQGWKCVFDETPVEVSLPDGPEFSFLALLKGFFEYIAGIPFATSVVSVLTGELICRKLFEQSPNDLPDAFDSYKRHVSLRPLEVLSKPDHSAVIHDPFKLNHNLVERVNAPSFFGFVEACETAAKMCADALNNVELQCSLFYQLFKSEDLPANVVPGSNQVLSIMMTQRSGESPEISFERFKNRLHEIFEKILLLNITYGDSEESKIGKVENMQDVHDVNHLSHNFICEGTKEVWIGRKKAKSLINLKGTVLQNPHNFKDEEYISNALAQIANRTNLKFQCEISCEKGSVKLEFKDLTSSKSKVFNPFMSFINQQLSKWISDFSFLSSRSLDQYALQPSTSTS